MKTQDVFKPLATVGFAETWNRPMVIVLTDPRDPSSPEAQVYHVNGEPFDHRGISIRTISTLRNFRPKEGEKTVVPALIRSGAFVATPKGPVYIGPTPNGARA